MSRHIYVCVYESPPLLRNCSAFGNVNKQLSATCASMFRCRRNTAVRLCPIYKMYFNHTIETLQHVKQAHWLPCVISCQISNRGDVTEPDPNPSIISKYLSEPDPARRVPSGPLGSPRVPSGLGWVSNKELFSGRDVWNVTFIHVPIGERSRGLFKHVAYPSYLHLRLWNSLPTQLRATQSLDSFKSGLKTFLFRKAYKC